MLEMMMMIQMMKWNLMKMTYSCVSAKTKVVL